MRRVAAGKTALSALSLVAWTCLAAGPPAPSYKDFEKRVGAYPYLAAPPRAEKIRAGTSQLRRCQSKAEVQALLGVPDFGDLLYGPKGADEDLLGSSWTYYLAKRSELSNEFYSRVSIFFDVNDRIKGARVVGIAGVSDIDGLSGEKCAT